VRAAGVNQNAFAGKGGCLPRPAGRGLPALPIFASIMCQRLDLALRVFTSRPCAASTNLSAWDGQYELLFKDGEGEPGEPIYHFCLRPVGRVTPCAPLG